MRPVCSKRGCRYDVILRRRALHDGCRGLIIPLRPLVPQSVVFVVAFSRGQLLASQSHGAAPLPLEVRDQCEVQDMHRGSAWSCAHVNTKHK